VTTSQTSQAAKPEIPANTSGEPSAMAKVPAPATMRTLPAARPSSRCHGRVNPLAWVASVAPMKGRPERGEGEPEGRRVESPGQLEDGGWLGQAVRGEHDRDVRGDDERDAADDPRVVGTRSGTWRSRDAASSAVRVLMSHHSSVSFGGRSSRRGVGPDGRRLVRGRGPSAGPAAADDVTRTRWVVLVGPVVRG
jgi:hypothetical protein